MNVLLGDFNTKLGTEDTFKPTMGMSAQVSIACGVPVYGMARPRLRIEETASRYEGQV